MRTKSPLRTNHKYNQNEPLSNYARFYFKYIGYSFKSVITGKVYTKGEFWDCYNSVARTTLLTDDIIEPPGFELITNTQKHII